MLHCSDPSKRDRFRLELSTYVSLGLEKGRAVKASKFSDVQKALILKQSDDGVPVSEIYRRSGISQAAYFSWKKKYAGLGVAELRRLKQLEEENKKLKQLVADLSLDKKMLQDVVQGKV